MRKELNKKVTDYIFECVDSENYNVSLKTRREKAAFLKNAFEVEYGWAVERYGLQTAIAEWLSGLPSACNIAYITSDILDLAEEWGSFPNIKRADKWEGAVLANWWNFIASKIISIFRALDYKKSKVFKEV